jgi:SET domain-containing protein
MTLKNTRADAKKLFRVGRAPTGLGLFATHKISRDTPIVEYIGLRIPIAEARARERAGKARYMFELNTRWALDGSARQNLARYVNHSCRPNAEANIIRGKVIMRSIKVIQPGDQITYDYGREYFDLFLKGLCRCAKCAAAH